VHDPHAQPFLEIRGLVELQAQAQQINPLGALQALDLEAPIENPCEFFLGEKPVVERLDDGLDVGGDDRSRALPEAQGPPAAPGAGLHPHADVDAEAHEEGSWAKTQDEQSMITRGAPAVSACEFLLYFRR